MNTDGFLAYLRNRASARTIDSYTRNLSHFVGFLREEEIPPAQDQIAKETVQAYLDYLKEQDYSGPTIAQHLDTLRSFFTYLKWSPNPAKQVSHEFTRALPSCLTVEQVKDFLRVPLGRTIKEIRDRAILEVLYDTGMTVGELTNLQLNDVALGRGSSITVNKSRKIKGRDRQRNVPLGKSAEKALRQYLAIRDGRRRHLFLNLANKAGKKGISERSIERIIKQYAKGLNLEVNPYILRHSRAVHLLKSGTDIRRVRSLLGHENLPTTAIYCDLAQNDFFEAYRKSHHPRVKGS